MTPMKIQKTFNLLDFKQKFQQQILEETKHLTEAEEIRYLHHRVNLGTLGQWWQSITDT
jgi:hypothetical protein